MRKLLYFVAFISLLSCSYRDNSENEYRLLNRVFDEPVSDSRPGVYWYFMDGNITKEGITEDLESMKKAGIGSVVFFEVNVGVPRGRVDFMSDEWKECFKHAVNECERLGISMVLGVGPGWTGSGGPWVDANNSMRHVVSSVTTLKGGIKQSIYLQKPSPKKPFFGEGVLDKETKKKWEEYYEDVVTLAFPKNEVFPNISDLDEKALYYRPPYSSAANVKQFLDREKENVLDSNSIIKKNSIINVSEYLHGDTLTWKVPEGEWIVMRFGLRNNGAITRPAPYPGLGLECDKTDKRALYSHLENFTDKLFDYIGERDTSLIGGVKVLHMDSWEMGAQNWSPELCKHFIEKFGYDPIPYFPVYSGYIVENKNISERFLWDLRQVMQELMLENHVLAIKEYANKKGFKLSIEPYDMNPMQDLELAAVADIPMCEFWSPGAFNTVYAVVEGTSVAHLLGQNVIPSEAFTSYLDAWKQHPASMKNQTDWAFAMGITRLYYHTYQHQMLPDSLRPGMTMGPYGVHWDRNQTWWPYVGAYHEYVARCQSLLQQGRVVSDILFLTPEDAPYVFKAPNSAFWGEGVFIDKKGYNFDACPASLLMKSKVVDGKIVFPSGMEYRLMVLPHFDRMTVDLLNKISDLVKDGAVVVGLPPVTTPGLSEYPNSEKQLKKEIEKLWGCFDIPDSIEYRNFGKGMIIWGNDLLKYEDNLYPNYELLSSILERMNVAVDFTSEGNNIRYIHRVYGNQDIYFISNRTDSELNTTCSFRVTGKNAYLWNPLNGKKKKLIKDSKDGYKTLIDIKMSPYESFFVIFSNVFDNDCDDVFDVNVKEKNVLYLNKFWSVNFDPKWGGPENIKFDSLSDWSKHKIDGIKYYSGTAIYSYEFDLNTLDSCNYILNLGNVKNIAKVWINGTDLGVLWTNPWKVDITQALNDGKNILKVEVTNLWTNRLIGDEFKEYDGIVHQQWPEWLLKGLDRPSDRFTFTTYKHYGKNSVLQPSGLLGPVTITCIDR